MSRKSSESGLVWRKDEKDAIRRHHAPLFAAWKRAWGQERRDPVDWIPGFRESLQSLLDQGYTVTDVGVFLGLTGERVRQYAREWADGPGRAWAEAEPLDIDERGRDELRYRALDYLRMSPADRAAQDDAGVQLMDLLSSTRRRDVRP